MSIKYLLHRTTVRQTVQFSHSHTSIGSVVSINIDGLAQDCSNTIANGLNLLQFWANSSICKYRNKLYLRRCTPNNKHKRSLSAPGINRSNIIIHIITLWLLYDRPIAALCVIPQRFLTRPSGRSDWKNHTTDSTLWLINFDVKTKITLNI